MKKIISYLSVSLVGSLVSLPSFALPVECPSVADIHRNASHLEVVHVGVNQNYNVEAQDLFFSNQHYWKLGAEIYADGAKPMTDKQAISYAKSAAKNTKGILGVDSSVYGQICDYQIASSDKHVRALWVYSDFHFY